MDMVYLCLAVSVMVIACSLPVIMAVALRILVGDLMDKFADNAKKIIDDVK